MPRAPSHHQGDADPDDLDPMAPHTATPSELRDLIGAQRSARPYLVLRDADRRLVLHLLDAGPDRQTIGRHRANDLCISWDGEVSGLHAEIQSISAEWVVVDDGLSTNGTFINGERVQARQRLRQGDRLRVGRTVIAFNAGVAEVGGSTDLGGAGSMPKPLTPAQRRVLTALCRPYGQSRFAAPATNKQIAQELFVTEDAVKAHLGGLFKRFDLDRLPQNEKRAKLAAAVLRAGLVSTRDES